MAGRIGAGSGDPDRRGTGGAALILIGLLIASAVLAVVLIILTSMQLDAAYRRDQARLALAADQQAQAIELARAAREAATVGAPAFAQLAQSAERLDRAVAALQESGPPAGTRALQLPLDDPTANELAAVVAAWNRLEPGVDGLIGKRPVAVSVHEHGAQIEALLARFKTLFDGFMSDWRPTGAASTQIYRANRQLLLLQRMQGDLHTVLAAGPDAPLAADRLGRDSALFDRVLAGLINGYPSLGITAVEDAASRERLEAIEERLPQLNEAIGVLLDQAPAQFDLQALAAQVAAGAESLSEASASLAARARTPAPDQTMLGRLFMGAALALLLVLTLLLGALWLRSREQRRDAEACQRDSREAIERLLAPLDAVVRGDLTVHAPVTAGPVGHLADAINAVALALRAKVVEIDRQTARAGGPLEEVQATAQQLAQANDDQIQHMAAAERSMTDVAAEVDALARQTAESAAGVRRVLELARRGAGLVGDAHEAAEGLQERLRAAVRNVEDLTARWREVDTVAELIYDLADQANILSLNASIQAAQAGDAGRGFAVVAEELQRLAARASEATKRVEGVAQALQSEAQALSNAIEEGAAAAGDGTTRSQEAVATAQELEQEAMKLAQQVVQVDEHAQAQAGNASVLAAAMGALRENSRYLAEVVERAAGSVTQLDGQLEDIRRWTASFKLTA